MTLVDAAARARIRDDLDTTLVVEAAAGTGKTTELIARLLGVLRSGRARLDQIALVTFTDKAAGEMKLRLRAELERALEQVGARGDERADDRERAHFEHALSALELAHIDTIHGFCAELLRERPIEAGVDPCFEVLDEWSGARLRQEAFDAWFAHTLGDPPEGVRRVLRRGAGSKQERFGPKQQLFEAARQLIEQRDFDAPWTRPVYDRSAAIDALVAGVAALGELVGQARRPSDYLALALRGFADFARDVALAERTRPRDYDGLEARLLQLSKRYDCWKRSGSGAFSNGGIEREQVLSRRLALRAQFDAFLAEAEADLAHLLQRELWQVVTAHEALKHKAGALDFVDLLRCTRDLMRNDPRARADLQRRFTHVFVDEFQDIDPVQAEILLWLASSPAEAAKAPRVAPGRLFVVGDPKQSIYRFRRADVAMYERVKRELAAGGAAVLHLTTSFRALPEIQAVVNAAFEPLMTGPDGDAAQAAYVALSPSRAASIAQPALIALPVPDAYGQRGDLHKGMIEESYPKAVAAFVAWLLRDSGLMVEDGGARVPVASSAAALYGVFLLMFLAPKLAGFLDVALARGDLKRHGGAGRFAVGCVIELVFSFILGASTTFRASLFMIGLPFGRHVTWNGQARDARALSFATALKGLWPQSLFGIALFGSAAMLAPALIPWSLPLTLGYILAIPFAMATASPRLGATLTRARLCATPEEFQRPAVLDALDAASEGRPASPMSPFTEQFETA